MDGNRNRNLRTRRSCKTSTIARSVVKFRLGDTNRCNTCLTSHAKKGKCPRINDCMLCLETCKTHIHSHIRNDCRVIKKLISEGKYSFPRGPSNGPSPPILEPERSNTVLGQLALTASKNKRERPRDIKEKEQKQRKIADKKFKTRKKAQEMERKLKFKKPQEERNKNKK